VEGQDGDNNIYKCDRYKLLAIDDLPVDLKYEFNSDNKRLYSNKNNVRVLAEGDINLS
jgi:hypothetical protein